jgi:hypothetical protein
MQELRRAARWSGDGVEQGRRFSEELGRSTAVGSAGASPSPSDEVDLGSGGPHPSLHPSSRTTAAD